MSDTNDENIIYQIQPYIGIDKFTEIDGDFVIVGKKREPNNDISVINITISEFGVKV